jgi:hypothetical protein
MLKRRAAKNRTKPDEKGSSELALPSAARRCLGAGGDAPIDEEWVVNIAPNASTTAKKKAGVRPEPATFIRRLVHLTS